MNVGDLLKNEIPTLILKDQISSAIDYFNLNKLQQLPVNGTSGFIGLIDKELIVNSTEHDNIESIENLLIKTSILEDQNIFHALRYFSLGKLNILPVVDKENNYLGCIHETDILQQCCDWLKVSEPGGIIHLEVSNLNYSLSQISQIIEGNGAKILTCLCLPQKSNTDLLEVIIKINMEELSGLIQTFERYKYTILGYVQKNNLPNGLNDRFDSFIRYLNI